MLHPQPQRVPPQHLGAYFSPLASTKRKVETIEVGKSTSRIGSFLPRSVAAKEFTAKGLYKSNVVEYVSPLEFDSAADDKPPKPLDFDSSNMSPDIKVNLEAYYTSPLALFSDFKPQSPEIKIDLDAYLTPRKGEFPEYEIIQ